MFNNNEKKIIRCHACEFAIRQTIKVPGDEENGLVFCRTCASVINKSLDSKFVISIEEFKKIKSEEKILRDKNSILELEIAKLKEKLNEIEITYKEELSE